MSIFATAFSSCISGGYFNYISEESFITLGTVIVSDSISFFTRCVFGGSNIVATSAICFNCKVSFAFITFGAIVNAGQTIGWAGNSAVGSSCSASKSSTFAFS